MTSTVPHRFLFRYSFPVAKVPKLPGKRGKLLNLPRALTLPDVGELDGATPYADIRLAWNDNGFGVSVEVHGKQHPPAGKPDAPTEPDGLQIWIDTRDTQSIHRASRFCHHFCVLPSGGGSTGMNPVAIQQPIARARGDAPLAKPEQLLTAAETLKDGYRLECWLPTEVLHGYDPAASPRLGFYYLIRDSELGDQFMTVGPEFPFAHDPSLWSTLELTE